MKKLLALVLASTLTLAVSACDDPAPPPVGTTPPADPIDPRDDIDECPRKDGRQCF